jgi:hypothetical protein
LNDTPVPLDEFLDLPARLPWWACAALAVLSFALMHNLAGIQPALVTGLEASDASAYWQYAQLTGLFGQVLLPLVFAAAAAASARNQWKKRMAVSALQTREFAAARAERTAERTAEPRPIARAPALRMPGPECPSCGQSMKRRVASRSAQSKPYWGCSGFPRCRGTLPL